MVQKSTKRYMLYRAVGRSENLGGRGWQVGSNEIQGLLIDHVLLIIQVKSDGVGDQITPTPLVSDSTGTEYLSQSIACSDPFAQEVRTQQCTDLELGRKHAQ